MIVLKRPEVFIVVFYKLKIINVFLFVGLQDAIILNLLPQLLIRRARGKNSTDVISIAEARNIFILHVTVRIVLNVIYS